MMRATVEVERWTLAKPFIIARGVETAVDLVVVTLEQDGRIGRGEACPVPHFGESSASVLALIEIMLEQLRRGIAWADLHDALAPGAARNAVDCAVWDLRAKQTGHSVASMAGVPGPEGIDTVFTISLEAPDLMAQAAAAASRFPILKLKLGRPGDVERVRAVRQARPEARLIADANEGWTAMMLRDNLPPLAELGVEMIEQPLRAGDDGALADIDRIIPIGADESCHVTTDVAELVGRYDLVNIKLDKTGGLTEALRLRAAARVHGLGTMVGCMLGTSLAMAPALLVAGGCRYVDLDAPLLMGQDRVPGLHFDGPHIRPAGAGLWG